MTSPSAGERAAISGYTAQYLCAASIIYEHLQRNSLEWVRLVDPDAGRVDDVVVGSRGRVDAYQVKWASLAQNYTYNNITSSSDKKPSLWQQLADGWQTLESANPNKVVRVHLVTNEGPSSAPIAVPGFTASIPFQAFWLKAFAPLDAVRPSVAALPTEYAPVIDALKKESGLSSPAFEKFFEHCELDFKFPDPRALRRSPGHDTAREFADIDRLASFLQGKVALAEAKGVELSVERLLEELGWTKRLSAAVKHYLEIPKTYKPIDSTIREIKEAVDTGRFGYIALLGGPGSGKSTVLTHTLRYAMKVRLVTYYAFLRDEPSEGRGEAANFWRDLYVALREQDRRPAGAVPSTSEEYRAAVLNQLQLAGEAWKSDGISTVILIDGLDHIEREQSPSTSLIQQLPLSDHLPQGVLIFLGSQSLQLKGLAPSISAHLGHPGRTLRMDRLGRREVKDIAEQILAGTAASSHFDFEALFVSSEGHPLATIYLLNELRKTKDAEEAKAVLDRNAAFGADVERRYDEYWSSITSEPVKKVLGMLCRIRVPVDLAEVLEWVEGVDTTSFRRTAEHYFDELAPDRWKIFHNSFRIFLAQKTLTNALGKPRPQLSAEYHREIARRVASNSDAILRREILYHYFEAGEFERVVALATQELFRLQFLELRPLALIRDDIGRAMRAAGHLHDGLAIVRMWLIECELGQRETALENSSLRSSMDAFLGLNALFDAVAGQGQLYVDRKAALKAARRLLDGGLHREAEAILDIAEPVEWLTGTKALSGYSSGDERSLVEWLRIAVHYRTIDELVKAIAQVRFEESDRGPAKEDGQTLELRLTLVQTLATAKYQHLDEVLAACASILNGRKADLEEETDWHVAGDSEQPLPERLTAVNRLLTRADLGSRADGEKVYLADLMRRVGFEKDAFAKEFAKVSPPSAFYSRTPSSPRQLRIGDFAQTFMFYRLRSYLGQTVSPDVAIPWPSQSRFAAPARFERSLISIANVWGAALRGENLEPVRLMQELGPAFRIFDRNNNADPEVGWYQYEGLSGDFFDLLIDAIQAHGAPAVVAAAEEFRSQWQEARPNNYWPSGLVRRIAKRLFESGDRRSNYVATLDKLEQGSGLTEELQDRLDSLTEQAAAWRALSEDARAASLLPKAMHGSFGIVHHKDRQIQYWVGWLDRVARQGVANVEEDVRRFGGALIPIVEAGRGRGSQDAAARLVSLGYRHDPSLGHGLGHALLEKGAIGYSFFSAGLIEGCLQRSDLPVLDILCYVTEVAVAVEIPRAEEIARHLTTRLLKEAEAGHVLLLANAVAIHEFEPARHQWLSGIRDALDASEQDVTWVDTRLEALPREQDRGTPHTISFVDGHEKSNHEVEDTTQSPSDLIKLLETVEPKAIVSWERVGAEPIRQASVTELQRIETLIGERVPEAKILVAILAEGYLAKGDFPNAERLARQQFASSEAIGWIKWFDGGTRLKPAVALAKAAPQERHSILERLASDYVTEVRNPQEMSLDLKSYLPILFDEPPWKAIWKEIREHVFQLREFEAKPLDFSCEERKEPILDAVQWLLALPIPEFEHRCCGFIAKLADSRNSIGPHAAEQVLDREPIAWKKAAALKLCDAKVHASCRNLIQRLRSETDLSVRAIACELSAAGQECVRIEKRREDAPLLLRIELPPLESLQPSVPVGDRLDRQIAPATSVDRFQLWIPELEALSEIAGVPLQNLLARANQVSEQFAAESPLNPDHEAKLNKSLRAIELKLTYRRPWADFSSRAMQHLCAELIDYGFATPAGLLSSGVHKIFDARLLQFPPVARPGDLVAPMEEMGLGEPREDWLQKVASSERHIAFSTEVARRDLLVVAEYTRYQAHHWEMPSETRVTMLSTSSNSEVSSNKLRDGLNWFPAIEHPAELAYGVDRFDLRFGYTRVLSLRRPVVAELGLRPTPDRPFFWIDGKDQPAGWCVHWRDGPERRSPPSFENVYGAGWLVLVRRHVLAKYRHLHLHGLCARQVEKTAHSSASQMVHVFKREVALAP